MSAPEPGNGDSQPQPRPTVDHESTGLWPIDDPEQTSHIQRPPAAAPAATESPTPATDVESPNSPAAAFDPEATALVPRPGGNLTEPWTSAQPAVQPTFAPPTGYLPTDNPTYQPSGYHQQPPTTGGHPSAAAYPQPTGYPAGPGGYPSAPGYVQQPFPTGEPPANFDITAPTKTINRSRRRTGLLIGAGVAVVAVAAVGITGFWKPGFFVKRQLNITKVQEGVQHVLTDPNSGYGISGLSGLSCNNGQNPSANQGDKFTCDMLIDGTKRHVQVTVTDDHGSYQVGKVT
ncbi:DUF4333 domain-containing protein [Mycolicibacterium llatzerense]|uniref:DUF4333 domain-containing protein n=1 Tax=Mycolicibacterium llatzerense TaxID=280871 RepID=UPI0031D32455